MNKLAVVDKPQTRSVLNDMAERYGMEPAAFELTIRATCMPSGKADSATREQFAAFLLVAKEYGLNPLTKEIYAFPTKSGGIIPIVGVDGWANLINSNPLFDGMDFSDQIEDGKLVAVTCRMHRKDRAHPIEACEYMSECNRSSEDKYNAWNKWPRRMLRHKAMIQAARYAFGFAGIYDPDEGERIDEGQAPVQIVKVEDIPSAPQPVVIDPIDHEKLLKDLETDLASCADATSLLEMWDGYKDRLANLFPPDRKAANDIYDRHVERFAGADVPA